MRTILLFITRRVLSLRYRVKIEGHEHLSHDGPILLLPNHVALVDPRIVLSFLGKHIALSPVASEKYYNKPVLKQVMDIFGTVPIAEASAGASPAEVKKVFETVSDALADGSNILIYPSGQVYRQGYESIKGKQAVYNIVQSMPDNTKIVGLRTRGLWGSIWSMAWGNGDATFGKAYKQSVKYVFSNLIFFVPKRDVSLDLHDLTEEIQKRKSDSLNDFNQYLETFLNDENGEKHIEPVKYQKHYFYYNDVIGKTPPEYIKGSENDLLNISSLDTSKIDESIKLKIHKKIAELKEISVDVIKEDANLVLDLYFDSLDIAEMKSYVQVEFEGASNPPITEIKTTADLYVMAAGLSTLQEAMKECDWGEEKKHVSLLSTLDIDEHDTILSLWKQSFKNEKEQAFMWDNIFGMQTKKDLIIKAYVVASFIKKLPQERIGIMLPSVGSASLIILATYLAGKTPVMFNWTLPKEAFDHCVKFSKVETILTSRNFYDRISQPFLEEYKEKECFLFLEDMLKNVGLVTKLSGVCKSLYLPIPKLPEVAVILFTSGSESLPKAVALTHRNVIENLKGSITIFDIKTDDRLIGFLPPFHSFGFTVNTIMPLITGLQIAYTPDPNDSKTILEIIKHTEVTAMTATPTFLKMILSLAKAEDLQTMRYAVVGAEKCPDDVFATFKKLVPNGVILEGYGITECSPVVSINPVEGSKPGTVGKIIPNLDCVILDIETQKPVQIGEQGMIFVKGSSIFEGYLDESIESPFEEIDAEMYYKTGDLGMLDADNFLTITGRLKRFVKIAGEMISLPFVEGVVSEKYNTSDILEVAVEALEQDGEVKICLFSVNTLELADVNEYLRERGVSNLIKISEIITVEEIPVLGTGKTDYKVLKAMIKI